MSHSRVDPAGHGQHEEGDFTNLIATDPPAVIDLPATTTAASAAHDMHLGSVALIWAVEQGVISEGLYEEAELAFDAAQNQVYLAALAEMN